MVLSRIHTALALLGTSILLLCSPPQLHGQPSATAGGAGIMVAGELWDSYMLFNNMTKGPWYGEGAHDLIHQIRVGNFDRIWSTPTHMWPGGWNYGAFWNKAMEISIWDPDSTFNPPTIVGAPNPSHITTAGSHYAFLAFGNTKRGKTLPRRQRSTAQLRDRDPLDRSRETTPRRVRSRVPDQRRRRRETHGAPVHPELE